MTVKVNKDVIGVLAESRIEGDNLYLPGVQLERKLYVATNKALKALGGKWNRKEKAHVFPDDPSARIEQLLQTGEYVDAKVDAKREFQFFETPEPLARQLVKWAQIQPGDTVLEPSAGRGRIADVLAEECLRFTKLGTCTHLEVMELNPENQQGLIEKGLELIESDFLKIHKEYDVIVANPPFSKQQDIDHVNHMLDLARRTVVSVMSASVLFRDNKKTVDFRERVAALGGTITPLPDDSFAESGTRVKTCVVIVHKFTPAS